MEGVQVLKAPLRPVKIIIMALKLLTAYFLDPSRNDKIVIEILQSSSDNVRKSS